MPFPPTRRIPQSAVWVAHRVCGVWVCGPCRGLCGPGPRVACVCVSEVRAVAAASEIGAREGRQPPTHAIIPSLCRHSVLFHAVPRRHHLYHPPSAGLHVRWPRVKGHKNAGQLTSPICHSPDALARRPRTRSGRRRGEGTPPPPPPPPAFDAQTGTIRRQPPAPPAPPASGGLGVVGLDGRLAGRSVWGSGGSG
jgi:hypothetical protein